MERLLLGAQGMNEAQLSIQHLHFRSLRVLLSPRVIEVLEIANAYLGVAPTELHVCHGATVLTITKTEPLSEQ
jgi:hypothetical protein